MSTTVSKLHENLMPKIIKSFWFQSSFNLWLNVSPLNFLLPIHTALVFVEFNFKPEAIANLLKMFSAHLMNFLFHLRVQSYHLRIVKEDIPFPLFLFL